MKPLITLFVLLFSLITYAQADLMIDFVMYDNAIPPNNGYWVLTFGLDSTATDGIDTHLGESAVPPDACCGWGGPILCGWFDLPVGVNVTWIDYRFGELPYTGVIEHHISYCSDPSSTEVTIQCSLPPGVTALLQDEFGGIIFNIVMADSNEYQIDDPYIGISLRLIVTYDNVLPAEFKSFSGSFLNSAVQLNWTTATETNNQGFEIEKKELGVGSQKLEWKTIGFVPGFGTTTESKSYSFIDEDVSTGTYKYRLKQIDFDGTFEYSNEIEVEVDFTPKEFVLYQNYPNPFNPNTVISYQLPVTSNVSLKIYDVLGNEVATLVNEGKQSGVYEVEFSTSHSDEGQNLSSGIYFYQLIAGSFVESKKMILLK